MGNVKAMQPVDYERYLTKTIVARHAGKEGKVGKLNKSQTVKNLGKSIQVKFLRLYALIAKHEWINNKAVGRKIHNQIMNIDKNIDRFDSKADFGRSNVSVENSIKLVGKIMKEYGGDKLKIGKNKTTFVQIEKDLGTLKTDLENRKKIVNEKSEKVNKALKLLEDVYIKYETKLVITTDDQKRIADISRLAKAKVTHKSTDSKVLLLKLANFYEHLKEFKMSFSDKKQFIKDLDKVRKDIEAIAD